MLKILSENLKLIMVGLVSILMIIAAAILVSLYFGGEVSRELIVTEIQGSATISRETKIVNASKNSRLVSGDIINTDKDSSLRISIDDDKYILVEPESTVYIHFTDIASKGDISVNLSKGAVICEVNKKLKKNATFKLKTPNSSINVTGTVFRTEFEYAAEYMGYENVMITQVQNFEGSANLQLYNFNQEPQDLPMVLTERTSAQLLTAENLCQYGYLNYGFDLHSMNSMVLGELIRAQKNKELAFSPEEVASAFKSVSLEEKRQETMTSTVSVSESTESETTTTVTTTTKITESVTTTITDPQPIVDVPITTSPPATEETDMPMSYDTLSTTQKKHAYTTYSGIKWWELTGNSNTDTDDYEDWFTEDEETEEQEPQETVTAGTSAD
ncbi:MAG: FecR domain-containing protein [Oscillospiraceae bacterium]|nr:FecR domain-containing protein [Oscillospiraceae bacterium]